MLLIFLMGTATHNIYLLVQVPNESLITCTICTVPTPVQYRIYLYLFDGLLEIKFFLQFTASNDKELEHHQDHKNIKDQTWQPSSLVDDARSPCPLLSPSPSCRGLPGLHQLHAHVSFNHGARHPT